MGLINEDAKRMRLKKTVGRKIPKTLTISAVLPPSSETGRT